MRRRIVNSSRRIEGAVSSPPTSERGSETGQASGIVSWAAWAGGQDAIERVTELVWPQSVTTYRLMTNDAQINSLELGATLPIRSYNWYLEPNGARPEVVDRISRNYNLPIGPDGTFNRRRGQRRFSFVKHLEDALRARIYGHYFFEQYGDIDMDAVTRKLTWNLRKLGVRSPLTLTEINVETDGALKSIRQQSGIESPTIEVGRLVAYVWDREGANWTGRSVLRPIYRNHLVKDRILRVGAINIERAGGTPYVEAPEGATADQIRELDALARRFRVGEAAGAALPHGAQLKFAAAAGGDQAVNYIKLQNEEMARSFLQMFQSLGQSSSGSGGALALGSALIDYFNLAQLSIADWFTDIFNEHVIEDDVEWNEGPDEEFAPLLAYSTANADEPESGVDAALGEDDGIMDPSGNVAAMIGRRRRRTAQGQRQQRAVRGAATASPLPLPPRSLRRQPYAHEIQAATDFAELDATYNAALDQLVREVETAQTRQIDQLHDAIVSANGDLDALAVLEADAIHSDTILASLRKSSDQAITQAVGEARRQGITVSKPDVDELAAALENRAVAVDRLLANSLAQTASRQAVRRTGGSLAAKEVANQVRDHLKGLSGSYLRDVLGGAVQQSVNAGRKLVFVRDGEEGDLFASELLDEATCSECVSIDGTQYASMADAESDYPTGGYTDCLGGERCRGTILKVYATEAPATSEEPGT